MVRYIAFVCHARGPLLAVVSGRIPWDGTRDYGTYQQLRGLSAVVRYIAVVVGYA